MSFSITGLSGSGLDTTQIVNDLMNIERLPLNNLETKKSNLQAEQGVFRAINTKLSALQTLASDLQYEATYSTNKATVSNSSVLSTTATGSAQKASYSLEVTQLAKAHSISISGTELLKNLELDTEELFDINGFKLTELQRKDVLDEADDAAKLKKLASIINDNQAAIGATASVIDISGNGNYAFTLTATSTGVDNQINVTHNGVSIFDLAAEGTVKEAQAAQDAKFKFNGVELTRSTNQFSDVVEGVTLNLQSTGSTTVTVGRDVDAIASQVEKFVAAYNDLISVVKTNLAKSEDEDVINPLQGDSLLKSIQNSLYNTFTGIVKSDNNYVGFMEEIGLSIDKGAKSRKDMTGQITFDKAAFTNALTSNPEKVTGVFTNRMTEMASTIFNQYTSSVKGIMSMKITGYDSEIKMVDDRLANMERSLQMKEARLNLQFNNMETLLASLNSEKDWLTSQFDSLLNANKK